MKLPRYLLPILGLSLGVTLLLHGCTANGRDRSRVIIPKVPGDSSRSTTQTAAASVVMAPAMPQPHVTIDPQDTVLQVINTNLRRGPEEEQVIAVKRIADVDSPVRVLVIDVDPERGTYYFQSWESPTNATDNRVFSLSVKDMLGDHDVQIVASGMSKDGKLTLDIFRRGRAQRGEELVYKPICQIVADDIHVNESERPDSYATDPKNGDSFPVDTFIRDPDSQNPTDLVKIAYTWSPQEGRYVPGAPEKVPGEKAAQAQVSKLSTSTDAASFEGFLAGSWVETLPDQPHPARGRVPSVLSFDPRARKIAFSQGDTQEVYTWRDTLRTLYNRAYLIGDNETVPQIGRTFAVTAQSAITLSVSIQSIDSGDSAPVTYGRIADETQARILARSGSRAAPALPPLDGEYSSTDGLTLDFHSPRLSWNEHGRQRSAEYVLFPLDGKVILSARFLGDERSGDENHSWTVDFKESKAPTGTVRSLTLSPAQLTVQGYEDAVGDTLSLEQDVDLRPR